mmetsp:Transcript_28675/g.63168  ORF Transcript_28675/g.63168 Transcript_28675/m.63168 type:complete len:92 (+) Transcript_28675:170-445(+)
MGASIWPLPPPLLAEPGREAFREEELPAEAAAEGEGARVDAVEALGDAEAAAAPAACWGWPLPPACRAWTELPLAGVPAEPEALGAGSRAG